MIRRLLLPLLAILLSLPAVAAAQGARDTEGEAEMLERINDLRARGSVAPLVRHAALDDAAMTHSVDMATHGTLAHVSPRTGDPAARVQSAGVHATRIAQNIAVRRSTTQALMSILESDAHRAQLLSPEVTHIGLAAVQGPRGIYVTQVVAQLEGPEPLPPPSLQDLRRRTPAQAPDAESRREAPERERQVGRPLSPRDLIEELEPPPVVADEEAEVEAPSAESPAAPQRSPRGPSEAPVDPRDRHSASGRSDDVEPSPRGSQVPPPPSVPPPRAQHRSAPQNDTDPRTAPRVIPTPEYRAQPAPPQAHAAPSSAAVGASATASSPQGAPTVRLPHGVRSGVAGYWIFYNARWWYFPVRPDTTEGSVLHADPRVVGPPSGYDAAGRRVSGVRPTAAPAANPRPPFGWSPRRHYDRWIQAR